jgi:hypothetical protein
VYYLPVLAHGEAQGPGLVALDLAKGTVRQFLSAPKRDGKQAVPGNLLLHEGHLVSQTATDITCYRPAK